MTGPVAAEQEILGALLLDQRLYDNLAGTLRPEHFSHETHGKIYEAIALKIERGQDVSPVLLARHFDEDPALKHLGGAGYLSKLLANCTAPRSALASYAALVIDASLARTAAQAVLAAKDSISNPPPGDTARDAVRALIGDLEAAMEHGLVGAPVGILEAVDLGMRHAEAAWRHGECGIPTGLIDLDAMIGGLRAGELTVAAGRPSMGKSALAGFLALQAAKSGHGAALFSLEMSTYQLAQRFLAVETGISYADMQRGRMQEGDFGKLHAARTAFAGMILSIQDMQGRPKRLDAIKADIRRLRRKEKIELAVVDYIGLIEPPNRYRGNRVAEMGEISAAMKALAVDCEIAIIAVSQLNRGPEQREDKRPMLSDLRESGSIEQDADLVMLVYRDEYYLERSKPTGMGDYDWAAKKADAKGVFEVNVAKNRNGPVGTIRLFFDPPTARFANLAKP